MDELERRQHIKKTFDTVCEGYDCEALRFFNRAAEHLPRLFDFKGDERVLDAAAGTGTPALAMAPHLSDGSITAVDMSSGMLSRAEDKTRQVGVDNIIFKQMDMTAMDFADKSFDAANCSFGLFFVDDMTDLASHITSKLKPGGAMVSTHFMEGAFSPLSDMFLARAEAYGLEAPVPGWLRVASEEQNLELFQSAGLINIETESHNVGYYLKDANQWWDVIWNAGYRGLIAGLEPLRLEQFKEEHLADIESYKTDKGIWLDVSVIFTRGYRS
ncbi:MAG: class I SAM-dependent methyltransferase [Gammaproteobacteria bacterium]|nr:class I SAM-dependent methyltransferase [Gammaproteobacteria bacterium]